MQVVTHQPRRSAPNVKGYSWETRGDAAYNEQQARQEIIDCLGREKPMPMRALRIYEAGGRLPVIRDFLTSRKGLLLSATTVALLVATITIKNIVDGGKEGARQLMIAVPIAEEWVTTGDNYRIVTGSCLGAMLLGWCVSAIRVYLFKRKESAWLREVALERASRPVPTIVSPYFRKTNTVYGDGRAADDFEADQGLRDHVGGIAPLFKE